jgi:hypothetical protein
VRYAVYADLSRELTTVERSAVIVALEANVPDSGCVGLQKGPNEEVYFCVEALSETEAGTQAAGYLTVVLEYAGLNTGTHLRCSRWTG